MGRINFQERRITPKKSVKLLLGLIILGFLVVLNIAAHLFRANLIQEDVVFAPPDNEILQKLLFKPLFVKQVEGINSPKNDIISDDSDDLFSMLKAADQEKIENAEKTKETKITFLNRPHYTACISKKYEYAPILNLDSANWILRLNEGPPGLHIDEGLHRLTGIPTRIGKHRIKIEAYNPISNESTSLEYDLYIGKRHHIFGTEKRGRDIAACLVLSSRWMLLPGMLSVLVAVLLGVSVGGYAGYFEGLLNPILNFFMKLTSSLPALVLLFLASVSSKQNLYFVMVVLGIIQFPKIALGIKNKVLVMKQHQFIEASQELGLNPHSVLWKDIIWANAKYMIFMDISYLMAFAVLIEVSLSYLKLGIQAPDVSLGIMLFEGSGRLLFQEYWQTVIPSCFILFCITGFYLIGDGINQLLKVKDS